jgi:hypothetical protein
LLIWVIAREPRENGTVSLGEPQRKQMKSARLAVSMSLRRAHAKFDELEAYAEMLERLVGEEFSRLYASEYLEQVRLRAAATEEDDEQAEEEPSDELVRLRDTFPNLMRGSLLPYMQGELERAVRTMGNAVLPTPATIETTVNVLLSQLEPVLPGFLPKEERQLLSNYKQLRDAVAQAGVSIGAVLRDPRRVRAAAQRTPGVVFVSWFEAGTPRKDVNKKIRDSGTIEFAPDFLAQALSFHRKIVRDLHDQVVAVLP